MVSEHTHSLTVFVNGTVAADFCEGLDICTFA